MDQDELPAQPEMNIGTAGHVDHGKTTLLKGLTGVWASKHSEELRRGITIRLGYADCTVYKCPSCPPPSCYSTSKKCPVCGSETQFLRVLSFVDCPGHEVLMTTMLSGAAVMDGAILVIAADEPVPQPQTREHVAALQVVGVKNIVAVQNKIDLVSREKAIENYKNISEYLTQTLGKDIPIIPISSQHMVNLDLLLEAMEEHMPTPERDASKPPYMHIVRSFDINKPGTRVEDLAGGVFGGTIVEGKLEVEDEVDISPGVRKLAKRDYEHLQTKVVSLHTGGKNVSQAGCGGLVGVGSKLDPALTKADGLIGNVVGKPNQLPDSRIKLSVEGALFDHAIGTPELIKVEPIRQGEVLVVNVGTSVTTGTVTAARRDYFEVDLKKPACAKKDSRVALSRKMVGKWRLIGYGMLKN